MASSQDDEALEIHRRFLHEGLDYYAIPDGEKVLHVWCWLVDAETNCLSLRHQLDKLRRQQDEEMKEVEDYVEYIWKLSSRKIAELEAENKELKEQIALYERKDVSRALIKEVQQLLIDEGLVDLASLGLKQQVTLLLAERAQLKNDLENLENENEMRWARTSRRDEDADVRSDDEAEYTNDDRHKRSAGGEREIRTSPSTSLSPGGLTVPMTYAFSPPCGDLPKNARHVYARNRSSCGSAAHGAKSTAETSVQFEDEYQNARIFKSSVISSQGHEPKNSNESAAPEAQTGEEHESLGQLSQCQHHQKQIQQQSERIRMLEKLAKQLELDNETLTFKLSEALTELDEMEDQLRAGKSLGRKGSMPRHSLTSVSSGKLELLQSYLDTKLSTAHKELSLVDQLQKLHEEIAKLQDQLLASGKQLETLAIKYQQRKARHKERIQRLRSYLDREQKKWKEQTEALEHKVMLTEDALQKQKDWCTKVEGVRYILQEEKRKLCEKLLIKEEQIRMKEHENLILLQRLQHVRGLESAKKY